VAIPVVVFRDTREGSRAATLIVMLPLLPGKQEAWRQFCQTLQGSRHHEYKEETHES
jgi:hypothetical protein